jgi:hypothetical protein
MEVAFERTSEMRAAFKQAIESKKISLFRNTKARGQVKIRQTGFLISNLDEILQLGRIREYGAGSGGALYPVLITGENLNNWLHGGPKDYSRLSCREFERIVELILKYRKEKKCQLRRKDIMEIRNLIERNKRRVTRDEFIENVWEPIKKVQGNKRGPIGREAVNLIQETLPELHSAIFNALSVEGLDGFEESSR